MRKCFTLKGMIFELGRHEILILAEPCPRFVEDLVEFHEDGVFRLDQAGHLGIEGGSGIGLRRTQDGIPQCALADLAPLVRVCLVFGKPRINLRGNDDSVRRLRRHAEARGTQFDPIEELEGRVEKVLFQVGCRAGRELASGQVQGPSDSLPWKPCSLICVVRLPFLQNGLGELVAREHVPVAVDDKVEIDRADDIPAWSCWQSSPPSKSPVHWKRYPGISPRWPSPRWPPWPAPRPAVSHSAPRPSSGRAN